MKRNPKGSEFLCYEKGSDDGIISLFLLSVLFSFSLFLPSLSHSSSHVIPHPLPVSLLPISILFPPSLSHPFPHFLLSLSLSPFSHSFSYFFPSVLLLIQLHSEPLINCPFSLTFSLLLTFSLTFTFTFLLTRERLKRKKEKRQRDQRRGVSENSLPFIFSFIFINRFFLLSLSFSLSSSFFFFFLSFSLSFSFSLNNRFRQGFRKVFCCVCFRSREAQLAHEAQYHRKPRYSCSEAGGTTLMATETRLRVNSNGDISLQKIKDNAGSGSSTRKSMNSVHNRDQRTLSGSRTLSDSRMLTDQSFQAPPRGGSRGSLVREISPASRRSPLASASNLASTSPKCSPSAGVTFQLPQD